MENTLEAGKEAAGYSRSVAGESGSGPAGQRRRWRKVVLRLQIAGGLLAGGHCYGVGQLATVYVDLSLEELGNIQVTSVSRREERLADAAAPVYVITDDAIRRAGARSLPDALRLAPNLQVARISSSQYAISARGFNASTANKLLVMIDGRTVYTPLYSGVFWDVQDVMLQDVDRIEVISGPGGTLWGTNAVNGVINIITRHPSETIGNLASVRAGGSGQGVAARHGAELDGDRGSYRLYAKFDKWRHSARADGASVPDEWDHAQAGFRSDWLGDHGEFRLQGDMYRGALDQAAPGTQRNNGANLLARWKNELADGSTLRIQTYYDHTWRDIPDTFSEELDTLDLDAQHSLPEQDGKQLIWGGGYRWSGDRVNNSPQLAFLPAHRTLQWANLFAQQEWALWRQWRLTAGARLEYNDYTRFEFLPNLKLAWKPADDTLMWVGLARAVRAPSRIDREFFVPAVPPYQLAGGPDFRSEIANTLDLGLRSQVGERFSYSLVLFRSLYDRVRNLNRLPDGVFVLDNQIKGRVDGLEAWASYQPLPSWSLHAGMTLMSQHFNGGNPAQTPPGRDPHSQWQFGSRWNIGHNCDLNLLLRHVGRLSFASVPAYDAVDASFGWRLSKMVELAVAGRNLFDPRHQEFVASSSQATNPIEIERVVDITLTARF